MKHWTTEDRERVATLLRKKLTAGQIAPKVGRSRSAVIGLVNRHPELKQIGFLHKQALFSQHEGRGR